MKVCKEYEHRYVSYKIQDKILRACTECGEIQIMELDSQRHGFWVPLTGGDVELAYGRMKKVIEEREKLLRELMPSKKNH